nr:0S ribosomal protein S17 [Cryptomonas sp.]
MVSGRVRTKTIKNSARFLLEKYHAYLTLDFQVNKKFCDEVALIPSKNLRNKIAGYVTHLTKRVNKGSVRGLSFKLQEKERDLKIEPKLSEYIKNIEIVEVDNETYKMLEKFTKNFSVSSVKFKPNDL